MCLFSAGAGNMTRSTDARPSFASAWVGLNWRGFFPAMVRAGSASFKFRG
jgi:hypothetical protein